MFENPSPQRPAPPLPPPPVATASKGGVDRAPEDRASEGATLSYLRDGESRRGLRFALAAAVAVHALLLLAPLPRTEATVPDPDPSDFRVVPVQRFKRPEPPPEEPPPQPVRHVAVPDPDPTDLEPLRRYEPVERPYELPPFDGVVDIPDAPPDPTPEHTGPYPIGGQVKAPVRLETPMPQYPEIARRVREECTVILTTVIDAGGSVSEIGVEKPCRFGLTEAAVAAVEHWRYHPATLNGHPVPVYMTLTVKFNLD